MKKFLLSILMVVLICSIAFASTTKAAPKKIVIKAAYTERIGTSQDLAYKKFKEYVEEQSNNRVSVQLYPNAQMGGDREVAESVALGILTMGETMTSVLTTYDPIFQILDIPYIFKNANDGFAALDNELGAKFDEILTNKGIHNLGYSYGGARSVSNNVRPINEPKDLKGLKIRVMESPAYIEVFNTLGANAVPISWSELFTALQQGVVDGQENPPGMVYSTKFYEVQKYYSLTRHTYSFIPQLFNDKFYQELPGDIKKIIDDGAKKYLVDWQRQKETDDCKTYVEKLKEAGMIVNEITPENRVKFVEKIKPLYENYVKKLGEDIFALVTK